MYPNVATSSGKIMMIHWDSGTTCADKPSCNQSILGSLQISIDHNRGLTKIMENHRDMNSEMFSDGTISQAIAAALECDPFRLRFSACGFNWTQVPLVLGRKWEMVSQRHFKVLRIIYLLMGRTTNEQVKIRVFSRMSSVHVLRLPATTNAVRPQESNIFLSAMVSQVCPTVGLLYLCVRVCIYTYIHPYIHTSIHPYIHTSIHPYIHTSIHPYIHTSIHPYIHTSIHPYLHTYIPTYLHTYIPTYLPTYIHTYITYIPLHTITYHYIT